jgi:methylenetetrahydrofolate dehydrogenase (NADP+)/methenyltetrahydrofolate cyclohydrolase
MIKLLGKPVADTILNDVRVRTSLFIERYHRPPQLSVILVGNDPASTIYTRKKGETATALGMKHQTINLSANATPSEVKAIIDLQNQDPTVDGILIQRPLPKGFKEEEVLYWVSSEKDVDAFHPINAGRLFLGLPAFQPCTPSGIMALLKYYQISPAGKTACVIGRSSIVGKPMASLLLKADATVLQCHSRTQDLRAMTLQADIVIVAAGKMNFIDQSYIKKGAVVIDVGIHKDSNGKTVGDVQFDSVAQNASALSPVPGGVGPLTIAILMENTITAAEQRERFKLNESNK